LAAESEVGLGIAVEGNRSVRVHPPFGRGSRIDFVLEKDLLTPIDVADTTFNGSTKNEDLVSKINQRGRKELTLHHRHLTYPL
jgi:hypothetical protein